MIKTIIIDDEAHCIRRLESLVAAHCDEVLELTGCFDTAEQGITAISNLHPELVFLDVQLDRKTGFDLLRQIPAINFEVIFTTAYEKYAVEAFKFSAVDYLLKPVDADELVQAVNKVNKKNSDKELAKKFEVLFHNLKNIQGSKKISVPTMEGLIFLEVDDIIHCHSHINYTQIHLRNNRNITVAKTLKDFEDLLSDYNFYRVHNSHLINLAHIQKYNKGKGGTIFMSDQSEIEVSVRRKDGLLKRIAGI